MKQDEREVETMNVEATPPRIVNRLDSRERLSRSRRENNSSAFLAEASQQGFTPSTNVKIWFEPARDFASLIGCAESDELCVRDRTMRADGLPVMLAVSRLPRDITRGTALEEIDTGLGGAHSQLEQLGYPPTKHEEINSARMPNPKERDLLGISSGPVLTVRRTTWSGTGSSR